MTLFWATYEQAGNTVVLWADDHTDRSVNLIVWSGQIPTTWFQAFNPFMIFAFTPFILALWRRQSASRPRAFDRRQDGLRLLLQRRRPSDPVRRRPHRRRRQGELATGSPLISSSSPSASSTSRPTSLSLVSKVAPAQYLSLMMGIWLATSFYGNFLAGYLGSFWSGMAKSQFFLMMAVIAALAGVVVLAMVKPLARMLKA